MSMSQQDKLTAYLKSLDHHRPHLLMVKMGADGQPEWWSPQGVVMGMQLPPLDFRAMGDIPLESASGQ